MQSAVRSVRWTKLRPLGGHCAAPFGVCRCSFSVSVDTQQTATSGSRKTKWGSLSNQQAFVKSLETDLGIQKPSDWYGVSRQDVEMRGGGALLRHHKSLSALLRAVYPEYGWVPQRFAELGRAPNGWWKEKENLMHTLHTAEKALGIQKVEDWYSVNLTDLKAIGFPYYISKLKLVQLLAEKYPGHKWDKAFLLKGRFAQQKRLERSVTSLFPEEEVILNARKEAQLVNPLTNYFYELDIFIPSLHLAFEYQDIHHYKSAGYAFDTLDTYQARDLEKQGLARAKGITLITIPCWWDGTDASLVATIQKHRPDLLPGAPASSPIPEEMPPTLLDRFKASEIPDIGEPMTACFFTGVHKDPTDWWIFEKFDGVRAFWNPLKKAFYSRFGKQFSIPNDIAQSMPSDLFLDGELWFGRDTFQEVAKISHRTLNSNIDWSKFRYMVFDIPKHDGTYAERYSALNNRLGGSNHPFVHVATYVRCTGVQHLEQAFQDIIDKGGEGIILRDPGTVYQPGRSPGYLKHKKFRDAEAKVIGIAGPQQWECVLPDGVTFIAVPGTTEFLKRHDVKVDDIVSFKHSGFLLGSGKPKSPALYRVRTDLSWDAVVRNWRDQRQQVTASPVWRPTAKHKEQGYWLNVDNRKRLFTEFAQGAGFDPLVAEEWEKVKTSQVANQGGASMLNRYKGNLMKALEDTFPELQFASEKRRPTGYWEDTEHRKHFFCEFAAEQGFDPLEPENWRTIEHSHIFAKKGGKSLMAKFRNNLQQALESTFPEFNFGRNTFPLYRGSHLPAASKRKPRGYWQESANRRAFFCDFAHDMGFDPLTGTNWKGITNAHILAREGGKSLLNLYNGSLRAALASCFPFPTSDIRSDATPAT